MKNPVRHHHAAFTLIELLAVITIIVILAGVVFGGMSYVNDKQANEKAKVQIALLSKALEEYKLDNGAYPPTANSAEGYTAGSTPRSIVCNEPGVGGRPSTLFGVLYQYGVTNNTKVYLPQLDPANNKMGWTNTASSTNILDPWGIPYRYRSAFGPPNASGAASPNALTQNPDFDLWSSGKDNKSVTGSMTDPLNKDDIRNF